MLKLNHSACIGGGVKPFHIKRFRGFTLAEVLITIGIIGVVAAVTIPTLVQSYQKQATCNKLKKTYSNLNNLIKMAEKDNGDLSTWDYSELSILDANTNFYKTYFGPYLITLQKNYSKKQSNQYDTILYNISGQYMIFQGLSWQIFSDGTSIALFNQVPSYFWIFADINGPKYPNKLGKDVFMFNINREQGRIEFWGNNYSISSLRNDGGYGCSKNNTGGYAGGFCGAWIMKNNWKIPTDYPW